MTDNKPAERTPVPQGPFTPASSKPHKIKLLLWGKWGVGKTTIALQFPKPAVLDLDGGAALYSNKYAYDILQIADIIGIKNAIAWLLRNPHHGYSTLVIDPITIYWELLQKFWSDIFMIRLHGSKQNKHEFFELGPREWSTIRQDFRTLFNKLADCGMHVVCTAREATKYRPGGFMVADGEKPDCEKGLAYLFDTVLRLHCDAEGKHFATCEKDRTDSLPQGEAFEVSYELLAEKFKIK